MSSVKGETRHRHLAEKTMETQVPEFRQIQRPRQVEDTSVHGDIVDVALAARGNHGDHGVPAWTANCLTIATS
jgi:hypothetical protein